VFDLLILILAEEVYVHTSCPNDTKRPCEENIYRTISLAVPVSSLVMSSQMRLDGKNLSYPIPS
jgi:hypothetical protein